MALATLSIDLVAKLANLEQGLQRATRLAEQSSAQITKAFARTSETFSSLGANLKGMFAGITFTALINGVVNSLDRLSDLRDATGATIENLSALEDLAVSTGTSFDKMSTILVRFNTALNEAQPDDDISRTFKAIGLSVEALRKLDPAEALRQTAVAFSKFADDGAKARAEISLFGKGVAAAGPLLADLASKTELVGTVTTKAAKEGENLANTFARIQKNVLDAARGFAGPLNSALEATAGLLEKINAWRDRRFAENDAKIEADRIKQLESVNKALAQTNLFEYHRLGLLQKRNELEAASPLRKRTDELLAAAGPRGGPGTETRESVVVAPKIDPKVENAIDSLIKKLRDQREGVIASQGAFSELEKVQRLFAVDPLISQAMGAKRAEIIKLAKELDALASKFASVASEQEKFLRSERAGQPATDEAMRQAKLADLERMNELLRAGREQRDPSRSQVDEEVRLRAHLDAIGASAEDAAAAINALYKTNADPALKALSEMELSLQTLAASIDETLGQGLEAMLTGHFDNIGQLFKRMLEQMAVKALQADLMNKLFGAANASGTRAGGGWIDALMGVGSSLLGASTGGGGAISAGEEMGGFPGLVSTAPVVNTTFEIAAGVSRNELAALMPTITQQVSATVMNTMRRPGFTGAT